MAGATNGVSAPSRPRHFPQIVLDTTLYDLLKLDTDGVVNDALCNVKPNPDPTVKAVPTGRKYLITSSQASDSDDIAHLQLENVSYLLSFWAGNMDVLLVAAEGWTKDQTLSKENIHRNGTTSFQVLNEDQRPRVKTFANVSDFIQSHGSSSSKVHWGFAMDFAEQIPSIRHQEMTYKINSKRWLAECPLKSANDQILDCACACPSHTTKRGQWFYGGSDCAACESAVSDEVARVCGILRAREPPYVLKLTQALGSVGTSLVRTREDRDEVLEHITGVLRESLPRLTEHNAHIHPTALVLSDFLPGETNALNFFIRRDGSPVFLGACTQLSTRGKKGGKQQTALFWPDQARLEAKFRDTLAHIGQVLHSEGYYGPAGADIMETPDDGVQFVIDLNVRSATSLILGLLRGHCEKRGFEASLVYECLLLTISRKEVEERFEREFEAGEVILLGTARLGRKRVWAYPVVLCGKDKDAVRALSNRILEFEPVGLEEMQEEGGA